MASYNLDKDLPYVRLTSRIIEACVEVSKELGPGFLESVYEKALCIALREKGLMVQTQVPIPICFRGEPVGQFFADAMVDEIILLELKSH